MLCRIALLGKVFVRNKPLNGDNRQFVFLPDSVPHEHAERDFRRVVSAIFRRVKVLLERDKTVARSGTQRLLVKQEAFLLRLIFCQMNMYICHCSVNGRQMLFGIPYDVSVDYTFSSEQYMHFRRVVIQRIKIVSLGEFFMEQIADNNVQIGVMRMMNVACGSGFHKTF